MLPAGVLSRGVRGASAILYSWLWSVTFVLVTLVSTGSAQVTAHFSFAQSTIVDTHNFIFGVAVDSSGDVYIADASSRQVLKETPSNGAYTQTVVADTTTNGPSFLPFGVAVDATTNVYIADAGNNTVVKVPWTGTNYGVQTNVANTTTNGPYFSPESVAVDAAGDVFIADPGSNVVVERTWNGSSYSAPALIGSNWDGIQGVAVDAAGNVYFSNFDDNLIMKVPASDLTCATPGDCLSIGSGLFEPTNVAVDANGNVYIADTGNNRVVKVPWTGSGYGTETTLGAGLSSPYGVAADNNGDVYISDSGNFQVLLEQTTGVNFNSVPVASTGASQTLTFTFDAAGSLNTSTPYQIVTQGGAGRDFAHASVADTCNGTTSYNPGDTCTVAAHFSPTLANTRYGAVSLYNSSGNPIATAYLHGIGQGPQIIFGPGIQSAAAQNGLSNPAGAAVDASGNLYIADSNNNAVHKYAPNGSGGYTRLSDVVTALNGPSGVAVDGAGNIYVADTNNDAVHKYAPATSGNYTSLGDVATGLNRPGGVAVDANGNVYIADTGNDAIHKYAPNESGKYTQLADVAHSGLNNPSGVAVDGSGNIYVADTNNNAVHEYARNANGGYSQLADVASVTLDRPYGVAVDVAGNVYVADTGNNAIHQYAPNGSGSFTQLANIGNGLNSPEGVTVDANGNVFAVDSGNARVLKEDFSDAPWLNFPTSTAVNSQDVTDGPKTVSISNMGNTNLTFSTLGSGSNPSYPANFPENTSDSNLCASGASLAPGSSCDISAEFVPIAAGANSGDINLTDNNLNSPAATQSISLTGFGVDSITLRPATTILPAGTTGVAYTQAFTATGGASSNYAFSSVGMLPAGLTLSSSGILSGAPTVAGSFSFTIVATDASSNAGSQNYTLSVNKGAATLTLASLNQTYTGSAHAVTATTNPAGLSIAFTYSGSSTPPVAAGSYSIVATINDPNFTGSTTGTLIIARAVPSITWPNPASIAYGTPLSAAQLDAAAAFNGSALPGFFTYNPASGTVLGTGTHTLSASFVPSDTTDFVSPASASVTINVTGATLNITANNATRVYGTPNPTFTGSISGALNGDTFTETFTTTASLTASVGSYPITPGVSGPDLSYYAVNATPGTLSITQAATTTTLSASAGSINPGQSFILTAQVKSATTGTPTGMVNFYDGTTLLGTAALTAASATYSTTALNAGATNSLTASYQGDTNFTPSVSASAVTIPVAALDFSLAVQGAQTQTVTAGGSAPYSLKIAPTYGVYPANVTFSVSGLPPGASVTFNPSTVTANGGAQTISVSVHTASTHAKDTNPFTHGTAPLVLSFLLLPFVGIRRLRNSGLGRGMLLALIVAAGTLGIASLSGCGTQFTLGQQLQDQNYTITVTGTSGSTQHSVDLTLTVD